VSRPRGITVVNLDQRAPERMAERDGWLISAFRTAFGEENGTDSLLFRATFRPGARHDRHRHTRAPEISICLSGEPIAGTDVDVRRIGPGTYRWIERDVSHFLAAADDGPTTEVVGLYVGAASVAGSGYVHEGDVTSLLAPHASEAAPYPCVLLARTPSTDPEQLAWTGAKVRLPLAAHEGCGAAVIVADTVAGASQGEVAYEGTDAIIYAADGAFELHDALGPTTLSRGFAAHVGRGTHHAVRARSDGGQLIVFLPHAADLRAAGVRAR
jgi:quercetin dioxygenase-like cupin family protein